MIELVIQGDAEEELVKLYESDIDWSKVVIVTDPPFNIGYHYNSYNDKLNEEEYYEMLGNILNYAPSVVIHYPESLYKISFQIGKFPEKVVSWVYNSNTTKQHRDIAFFDIKPDFRKYGQDYKNPTDKRVKKLIEQGKKARLYDWWEINQVKNVSKKNIDHPAVMPLEVMKRIIGILPEDSIILDPYSGSGTTGLAAKELGRSYILIEQDPYYIEIINKRLK